MHPTRNLMAFVRFRVKGLGFSKFWEGIGFWGSGVGELNFSDGPSLRDILNLIVCVGVYRYIRTCTNMYICTCIMHTYIYIY